MADAGKSPALAPLSAKEDNLRRKLKEKMKKGRCDVWGGADGIQHETERTK